MFRRKLACSFCGRSAADVEKLVAGPKVFICDKCAIEVIRILDASPDDAGRRPESWRAVLRERWNHLLRIWFRRSFIEAKGP